MLDLSGSPIEVICDFIETVASSISPKPLSKAEAREIAVSHAGINSLKVDRAFQKLKVRKLRLGDKYPFLVEDEFLCLPRLDYVPIYISLLALTGPSPLRQVSAWNLTTAAKVMEKTVENCFFQFFGSGTKTVNFGFPSEIQRPAEFGEAIKWLSEKTGIPVGSGYRPTRYKDGGVDIFVWKEFKDKFPGVPILLLQCTIQEKFIDKIGDVDRRLWASWLSSDIDPIVGLCVSSEVESNEVWAEVTTRGLLFDRIRLVTMAESTTSGLNAVEAAFINQILEQFRVSFA